MTRVLLNFRSKYNKTRTVFLAHPVHHQRKIGRDHLDVLRLHGYRQSKTASSPTISHWLKQSTWLRTGHCRGCWQWVALCTPVVRVTTLQTMWNSMTFPWRFAALLPMLSVTHIMPVLVLSVVGVGMQQCMIRNQNEMHKLSKVKNGRKYAADNKQF